MTNFVPIWGIFSAKLCGKVRSFARFFPKLLNDLLLNLTTGEFTMKTGRVSLTVVLTGS